MPSFFNPQALSVDQKSLWDWAMTEYRRVQDSNIDRQIANMSEFQRQFLLDDERARHPGSTANIRDILRSWAGMMGGGAGSGKSALFARLLSGKPALPYPPPTSFSYPWYEVVEEPGPFPVTVGSPLAADCRSGASDEMVIDQCSWKIVSSNAAATELSQLQSELNILGTPAKAGGKHRVYHWTQDLFQRVDRAYESGPELMVEFGEWPAYRLRIGRHVSQSQRKHAENVVAGANRLHSLQPASSVFDTHYLCFSPAIGRTVAKGVHPKARLEQSQSRVKAAGKEGGMFSGLDQLAMDHQKSTLKQDVAEFEARPDGWDWVELSYDTWVLEKAR